MGQHTPTPTELTNMIMLEDPKTQQVLVENRKNPNWPGVTFPGGHIEPGETITSSIIRETVEETGLTIIHPQLVGIKEWSTNQGRYLVFLFKCHQFSGQLKAGREGEVFWTSKDSLQDGTYPLPPTFLEMLPVFEQPNLNELALIDTGASEWTLRYQ